MFLDGTLRASAGGSGSFSGELLVALDAENRNRDTSGVQPASVLGIPVGPRQVVLTDSTVPAIPEGLKPGDPVPGDRNGFAARQVYPSTLTKFTLAVRDNPQGRVSFSSTQPETPVFSVGSTLTVQAAHIVQAGTLKAPLGAIALQAADTLTLSPDSLTSTSMQDQLVPFGRVELGREWIYGLDSGGLRQNLVFAAGRNAFPEQRVSLVAPRIALKQGAVVDQSGGGDLLAYEFQPGLSGSRDVLDPVVSPGLFAILPAAGGRRRRITRVSWRPKALLTRREPRFDLG